MVSFIEVKESLKRPECFRPGNAPSSCRDLHCIGYKLNGFYFVKGQNKMETVYCDFDRILNDPKITQGKEHDVLF